MKKSVIFALVGLLAISLTACSNPKDANKTNFTQAINEYLKDESFCIYSSSSFPSEVRLDSESELKANEALVAVGLLSEKQTKITDPYSRKTIPAKVFNLTDEGKKYFKETRQTSSSIEAKRADKGFCYADKEVAEIVNFTEPSNSFTGVTFSQVNFKYRAKNIAEWIKNKDVQSVYNSDTITKYLDSANNPIQDEAALILTNDGWVHQAKFKK